MAGKSFSRHNLRGVKKILYKLTVCLHLFRCWLFV